MKFLKKKKYFFLSKERKKMCELKNEEKIYKGYISRFVIFRPILDKKYLLLGLIQAKNISAGPLLYTLFFRGHLIFAIFAVGRLFAKIT